MIGKSVNCPTCSCRVEVPRPSVEAVRNAIGPLPLPTPDAQPIEFHSIILKIRDLTVWNIELANLAQLPDLAKECIRDAKRSLRTIMVLSDESESEVNPDFSPALMNMAAGHDIAGIGDSRSKRIQYQQWAKQQTVADKPEPSRNPIQEAALEVIEALLANSASTDTPWQG